MSIEVQRSAALWLLDMNRNLEIYLTHRLFLCSVLFAAFEHIESKSRQTLVTTSFSLDIYRLIDLNDLPRCERGMATTMRWVRPCQTLIDAGRGLPAVLAGDTLHY